MPRPCFSAVSTGAAQPGLRKVGSRSQILCRFAELISSGAVSLHASDIHQRLIADSKLKNRGVLASKTIFLCPPSQTHWRIQLPSRGTAMTVEAYVYSLCSCQREVVSLQCP